MNGHFCDHTRNIMTSKKSIAIRIYDITQKTGLLTNTDDIHEFVHLVAEFIFKDYDSVNRLINPNLKFNDALKYHFKSLLITNEKNRMLDVDKAF